MQLRHAIRHQTYPADDMRMENLVRNQQAITATSQNEHIVSNAILKSDRTPTSSHGTHQVSTTSPLSGCFVTAVYMDDKCTTVLSAVAFPLNTCIGYRKIAATADTEFETIYSDLLCTAKVISSYLDYTASCVTMANEQSTLAFVNSNGVLASTLTMASIRSVYIISLSCFMASLQCSFPYPCLLSFLFSSILVAYDLILHRTALYNTTAYHTNSIVAAIYHSLSYPLRTSRYRMTQKQLLFTVF